MSDRSTRHLRLRSLAVALSALALGGLPPVAAHAAEATTTESPAAEGSVVGPTVAVPPPTGESQPTATATAATTPAPAPSRPVARQASAAGDPGVTIRDFNFGPSAVTIKVGETITWTNDGPTAHTATGSGFDTGILRAGQSSSHTFTSAGTFSYHCTLHPFMKGTITVVGAAAGGGGATSGAGGGATSGSARGSAGAGSTGSASTPATGAATAATPTTNAQALPNTGLDAWQMAALGALSLLCGLALRRATRPRSARTSRAPRGF